MTDDITYPPGTGREMMKFTAGGIVIGLAVYGAGRMGSAFMTGSGLLMFCVLCIWFFTSMRHATLMARVGPQVTDEMRKIYASPARIALQVLAIMAISLFTGVALGWLLDVVVF
jgi:hypothetical protein